jgi:hypothetical protein
MATRAKSKCTHCHKEGHNRATCGDYQRLLGIQAQEEHEASQAALAHARSLEMLEAETEKARAERPLSDLPDDIRLEIHSRLSKLKEFHWKNKGDVCRQMVFQIKVVLVDAGLPQWVVVPMAELIWPEWKDAQPD